MVYLTQSIMADDAYMRLRVASCAAQKGCTEVGIEPDMWTMEWRRVWSTGNGWALAWEQARNEGVEEPGSDPTVVTDDMIDKQIGLMMPFTMISDHKPNDTPSSPASREYADMLSQGAHRMIGELTRRLDAAGIENIPPLPINE